MVGRIGLVVAATTVGVLGGKWWLSQTPSPFSGESAKHRSASSEAALQAQLAKQNEVLAQLSARLAHFEHSKGAASGANRTAPGPRSPDDASNGESPRPTMTPEQLREMIQAREAEAREQGLARLASIEGGWAKEPVDPGWADRYEADIRGALGSSEFESISLTDVDCRSSVCKLELSGDASVEPENLNTSLVRFGPFQNTEFTTARPEGGDAGDIVIYLSRPGSHSLGQFESSGS